MNTSTITKRFRLLASLILMASLTGCINLDPVQESTTFHVLGQASRGSVDPIEVRVAIRDTHLIDFLNNSQVVELSGTSEVRYLSEHRWAGALDSMLSQVVASELEASVKGLYATAGDSAEADLNIDITILQFCLTDRGGVSVSMEYRIVDAATREAVAEGRVSRSIEDAGNSIGRRISRLESALREAVREMADRSL
ncbi:MAG: membrane integrity-associated transporter subunit PqiC [Puniceicoccaceae bacterium]